MSDNYAHMEWIGNVLGSLQAAEDEFVVQDVLMRASSEFANLTAPEKRDVFIMLLGIIIGSNDGV